VYLYGSTRVGEYLLNRDSAVTWNRHYYRVKGNRHYELTNHLGNVLAVVTDRKIAKDTTADATHTPQFYMPDVYSVQNYYAFGQSMPNWSGTAAVNDPKKYRFGYNGKEDDDEWAKQDYGFRISDPRIGRFLSVDPLAKKYPQLTTYQYASNRPIDGIDQDGLEWMNSKFDYVLEPKRSGDPAADDGLIRGMWAMGWRPVLEEIVITGKSQTGGPSLTTSLVHFSQVAVNGMGFAFGLVDKQTWESVGVGFREGSGKRVLDAEIQMTKASLVYGTAVASGGGSLTGLLSLQSFTTAGVVGGAVDGGFQYATTGNVDDINLTSIGAQIFAKNPYGGALYGTAAKITVGDVKASFGNPESAFGTLVQSTIFGKKGSSLDNLFLDTAVNGAGNEISGLLLGGMRVSGSHVEQAVGSLGANTTGNSIGVTLDKLMKKPNSTGN
jgi:RHS repeat-associated protein